jgi:hypothetical protein
MLRTNGAEDEARADLGSAELVEQHEALPQRRVAI